MTSPPEPIRLTGQQLQQAAQVAGRAFQNDPLYRYAFPEDTRRLDFTTAFLEKSIRYCFLYGEVWTTPDLDGLACWLTPENTALTLWRIVRSGLLIEPLRYGWSTLNRLIKVSSHIDGSKARVVPKPFWHLWILGVEPSRQGQGTGGRLLQSVLARADRDRIACFLDTENEINLPFYEKHGFRVAEAGEVDGLRFWTMLREPQ